MQTERRQVQDYLTIQETQPMKRYRTHYSILNMALNNGWKVTKVYNTLTFTVQRIREDYIQFNQDKRFKDNKQGLEFFGLFHKLMNNGLYGWFCRAIETYKETQLLFSGADSCNHFEVPTHDIYGGKVCKNELCWLVVQNPHNCEEVKKQKISSLFDDQLNKAKASSAPTVITLRIRRNK